MIHNRSFANNVPTIALALALITILLMGVSLAQPFGLPAPYAISRDMHPRPALGQTHQAAAERSQAEADAYNRQRAREAEIARWQGMTLAYSMQQTGLSRAQLAEAARWQGMARYFAAREAAALERSRAADAARWQGMALAYSMQQTGLSRAQLAEAARWTAMAILYGAPPEQFSPFIMVLLGR